MTHFSVQIGTKLRCNFNISGVARPFSLGGEQFSTDFQDFFSRFVRESLQLLFSKNYQNSILLLRGTGSAPPPPLATAPSAIQYILYIALSATIALPALFDKPGQNVRKH